jgi:hypothetical protein
MNTRLLSATLICLLQAACCLTAKAHWQNTNYTLKGGWNAIYLHGDASYATDMLALFPNSGATANVTEVWRWVPNPDQVQFTTSPLLPTPGTPEWLVWKRDGTANTLATMHGQSAYLVKCAGNATATYTVTMVQKMLPPSATWVRNGANLLGFPSKWNASYPTFGNYFSTFPAAIAANTKIYKYVGGELSASNPMQIFSTATEPLDRNHAYWFDSKVVGNFYAPLQISLSRGSGLDFDRTGSLVTARVLNRTATPMVLTIAPVASDNPPGGQELVTGPVPITLRTFDTGTATWTETLIQTEFTEIIGPNSSRELNFGIQRSGMPGSADALFASLLRFTDAANQFDILIPATARKASLAGLWIGNATVQAVESKPQADVVKPTGRGYPLRYLLHVPDVGPARILSQAFIGKLATPPNDVGICTKEVGLKADAKGDATRLVVTHMPLDRVLDGLADDNEPAGSGSVAVPGTLVRHISLPFNDPTNPFVHQYHPDHDNKSPTGAALVAGQESHTVTSGWGSTVIGGTYEEVIQGLHKDSTGIGTGDGLRVAGTFELRRVSEQGTLSVTP